jgi:signal transduction histidine kinase
MSSREALSPLNPTATRRLIAVTAVGCALVAASPLLIGALGHPGASPGLRILLDTSSGLIVLLASFLVMGRFTRSRRVDDLLLATSLSFIAAMDLSGSALVEALSDAAPATTGLWLTSCGRLAGALLFAAAALAPSTPVRPGRRPALIAFGFALAALVACLATVPLVTVSPAGIRVVQALTGLTLAGATAGLLRRSAEGRDELFAWFAAAAYAATLAEVAALVAPAAPAASLTTADAIRLLSQLLLLVGAAREISGYWQRLSEAAVLEERRRLARELHDGLAQELAFIYRLARDDDGSPVARAGIAAAAERALDESRRAIAALTRPLDEPLAVALAQATEEVAARCAVVPHLDLDLDPAVVVDRAARDALIRVACEAVANAARHGHAGNVRVRLAAGDAVELIVLDDGVGFDTAAADGGRGFGLVSMRERVESLGGRFTISSYPSTGTRVEVAL